MEEKGKREGGWREGAETPAAGNAPRAKGLRRRRGEEREKEGMEEDGEGEGGGRRRSGEGGGFNPTSAPG